MRQKRSGKVFLAAVLVLAVLFAWQAGGKESAREDEKVFPAEAWIMALEQKDTGAIKAELNARDEAQRQQAALAQAQQQGAGTEGIQAGTDGQTEGSQNGEGGQEEKTKPDPADRADLKRRFGQAVIVGDSVAEGFIDYEILDPSSIIAQKGLRADSAGPDIEKALALSPSCLFLSIGLNDLEYCEGDSSRFVSHYEARLQEIQEKAPELPVYVNAIMPVLPAAVEAKPVLGYVEEFNGALKALCEGMGIPFLDNGDILDGHEDWYQKDSVHLTSQPYPLWLARMEEAAGL